MCSLNYLIKLRILNPKIVSDLWYLLYGSSHSDSVQYSKSEVSPDCVCVNTSQSISLGSDTFVCTECPHGPACYYRGLPALAAFVLITLGMRPNTRTL